MDENLSALSLLAASLTPRRQVLDRLDGILAELGQKRLGRLLFSLSPRLSLDGYFGEGVGWVELKGMEKVIARLQMVKWRVLWERGR